MVQINYRDPRPIYEQLRDGILQLILTGVLEPGSKLPSANTIQRAYRELEAEGCIASAPGRGSFVCQTDAARLARRAALTAQLREAARELRALGLTDGEIAALTKEEDSHD